MTDGDDDEGELIHPDEIPERAFAVQSGEIVGEDGIIGHLDMSAVEERTKELIDG